MGSSFARFRIFLLLLAALCMHGSGTAAEEDRYPPETLLLFVASWCAPCHAELAQLPAIARGAQPYRVLVLPFDDKRASLAMLSQVPAAQRWIPGNADRRRMAAELFGDTSGLPFSVAIGADGRPCGTIRLGLDAARAEALVAGCRRRV